MNINYLENIKIYKSVAPSSSTASSTASSSGGPGGYTMWIILGVLVVVIVGLFVFTAIKDKIKKNKKKKETAIFKQKTNDQLNILNIRLKTLIEINEKFLDEFKPSIGKFKMGDIVNVAINYLNNIEKDPEFREFIVDSDNTADFLRAFVKLSHTRCNNWAKQCEDVKKYFDEKVKKIDEDLVKEVSEKATQEITEFYEKGLYSNELAK